jgi:hypothetical protein
MAKAAFHKHQRVFVKPVGTWTVIEKIKPHWVKDVEEPVKIFYDCGLGRDFIAAELAAEAVEESDTSSWRLMRAKNKWQSPEECAHHPQPGSYPVVVTDAQNWGGWRVPGAEYDRDPGRVEHPARLIVHAPRLLQLAEALAREVAESPDAGADFVTLGKRAADMVRAVRARPDEDEAVLRAAG